MKEKSRIL